ncbi:hypothetical protein GUITHDRAFT_135226 [Guillardia theta CCMP2712]|uniref:Uncharacterized protein n=1 Tax=Guillardia theta (strain CCMP2712) TaxID=905079 RepID=L1JQ52_GUITC|nr:hypothetical protein GUITHDRAFT_135226 [Guillardia theta CCMP2712]EKX50597.1 hypothetical protein GUITHDRAFT_135226 [Guillardia theta CCMP2712]|eukprot:XP_005837577.1 hypothetical protein GUITHDRAFT_135226 [Guillardia theta CCMP2712]
MAQIEAWNLRDAWLLLLLQVQKVTHLPPQLTLVAEGTERVLAVRSHGHSWEGDGKADEKSADACNVLEEEICDEMTGGGAKSMDLQDAGARQAQGLLLDGRLAYPREDTFYCEAMIQWNIACLSQLRAFAAGARASKSVLSTLQEGIDALSKTFSSLPIQSATQDILTQVKKRRTSPSSSQASQQPNPEDANVEELGTTQLSRLKEIVQAGLLLHALGDLNGKLGFAGNGDISQGRGHYSVKGSGAQFNHLYGYSLLLIDEVLTSSSFGPQGKLAADLICDPSNSARQLLLYGEPSFAAGLWQSLANNDGGGGAGSCPSSGSSSDDYQTAAFNCYVIRRVHMHAEPSRNATLLSVLNAMLRVARELAGECFPVTFSLPSPFAPLIISELR